MKYVFVFDDKYGKISSQLMWWADAAYKFDKEKGFELLKNRYVSPDGRFFDPTNFGHHLFETCVGKPTDYINYLDDSSFKDEINREFSGYSEAGWYFWDETLTSCHGPFKNYQEAYDNSAKYFQWLNSKQEGEAL